MESSTAAVSETVLQLCRFVFYNMLYGLLDLLYEIISDLMIKAVFFTGSWIQLIGQ